MCVCVAGVGVGEGGGHLLPVTILYHLVAIGSGLALPVSFGDRELLQVRVELEAEAVHLSVSR